MYALVQILVPISICVILPVAIVWLICRANMNNDNKRTEVLIEAIKSQQGIDTVALTNAFAKPPKSERAVLFKRLLRGCLFTLVGIGLIVALIVITNLQILDGDELACWIIIDVVCLAIGISYLIVYFTTRNRILSESDNSQK